MTTCSPSTSTTTGSGTGFPTAGTMDQLSTNYALIAMEECAIQQAILAAASQCQPGGGKFCTTVGGTTPMTFVSGVSSITVVNGGANYFQDSPMAVIVPPIGSPGTGAVLSLVTNGGNITAVNVVSPGTGYLPINATMSVSSVLGTGANLQPLVDGTGAISTVNIVAGGTGYTINDTVTATRAVAPNIAYVNAVFAITAVSLTGQIVSVAVLNGGSGYEPSVPSVAIVSTLNPSVPYLLGTGFWATVSTNNTGGITSVLVNNTGYGYAVDSPYLVISDVGTGASTAVTLTTPPGPTSVASIAVTAPGNNYDQLATGTVLNPTTAMVAATAGVTTIGGAVAGIFNLIGGGMYTSVPTATFSNALGPGTGASATITVAGGVVTAVSIVQGGIGYTNGSYSNVALTNVVPGGTGGSVDVTVAGGVVTAMTVDFPGTGYTNGTYTAYLSALLDTQALGTPTISNGRVNGITITHPGTGYNGATVTFSPPANPPNPTPAAVTITVPVNTFGTNPNLYWQVWAGTTTNTAIQNQLNAVLQYFTGLGYTISIQSNPATGTTIQWKICW